MFVALIRRYASKAEQPTTPHQVYWGDTSKVVDDAVDIYLKTLGSQGYDKVEVFRGKLEDMATLQKGWYPVTPTPKDNAIEL